MTNTLIPLHTKTQSPAFKYHPFAILPPLLEKQLIIFNAEHCFRYAHVSFPRTQIYTDTHSLSYTHAVSHTHTQPLSCTHSLSYSLTYTQCLSHAQSLSQCLSHTVLSSPSYTVYIFIAHTHTHARSHTHVLSPSVSHTHTQIQTLFNLISRQRGFCCDLWGMRGTAVLSTSFKPRLVAGLGGEGS